MLRFYPITAGATQVEPYLEVKQRPCYWKMDSQSSELVNWISCTLVRADSAEAHDHKYYTGKFGPERLLGLIPAV